MKRWLWIAAWMAVASSAVTSETDYYRRVTLPLPETVPLEVSGLEVLPDGRPAAAIRKGEVWVIDNAYDVPPQNVRYHRIAQALHEPLGLLQHNGDLYVAQRSELTHLRDTDHDGIVDVYRTLCQGWGVTGNYHEYAFGPEIDSAGNFWVTLNTTIGKKVTSTDDWRGWALKITPDGEATPYCAGLRSPSGLGRNTAGDIFYTDQQGNWIPTGTLVHIEKGAFYGHADSLASCELPGSPLNHPGEVPAGVPFPEALERLPELKMPAVWFPYKKAGMSATDIVCDQTGGAFGPFEGQLFVGDFTMALITRVQLEKVNGRYQGACFNFRKGFQSAVVRMDWGKDGSLFVGETNRGWNSLGERSYGLERLIWTGKVPFEVKSMHALPDGFELVFTLPVNRKTGGDTDSYAMNSYTYYYRPNYGSPEIDKKDLVISNARLSEDGLRVRLTVEGLRAGYVHELHLPGVRSAGNQPLLHNTAYYTMITLPR